jgi:pyruvate ferredoxin oxidoreductase gamma subunit/2-oxoisovalerate ferredoxin oxidoreductase gamma subunit
MSSCWTNLCSASVSSTRVLKKGTLVINGKQAPHRYRDRIGLEFQVFVVDAASIAVTNRLGSSANPIVNTAILGAFSRASGLVGIDAVETAIEEHVPIKKQGNRRAARQAYDQVGG